MFPYLVLHPISTTSDGHGPVSEGSSPGVCQLKARHWPAAKSANAPTLVVVVGNCFVGD
jgi:hypothetical protein